jgi:hypothetical protein
VQQELTSDVSSDGRIVIRVNNGRSIVIVRILIENIVAVIEAVQVTTNVVELSSINSEFGCDFEEWHLNSRDGDGSKPRVWGVKQH